MAFVIELAPGVYFAADGREKSWTSTHVLPFATHFARKVDAYNLAVGWVPPNVRWSVEPVAKLTASNPDQRRYPHRTDWPIVETIGELGAVIFSARERVIGIRIPCDAHIATKISFEPPWRLMGCLGSAGQVLLTTPDIARDIDDCWVEATFLSGYFPAENSPRTEWHCEYSLDFAGVPEELVPVCFRPTEESDGSTCS